MATKTLIALCLAGSILPGCGDTDNSVAVPKGTTLPSKTEPAPLKSASGKPASNSTQTAD